MTARPATTTPTGKRRRGTNPQPLDAANIADALLTMRTAAVLCGMSVSTLYRKAKEDPTFPRLRKVGSRCTRLLSGELAVWRRGTGA